MPHTACMASAPEVARCAGRPPNRLLQLPTYPQPRSQPQPSPRYTLHPHRTCAPSQPPASAGGWGAPRPRHVQAAAAPHEPHEPQIPPSGTASPPSQPRLDNAAAAAGGGFQLVEGVPEGNPEVAPTTDGPVAAVLTKRGEEGGEHDGPSGGDRNRSGQVVGAKVALLAALSSLDRGIAANAREAAEVDQMCRTLEALGGPVVLASAEGAAAKGGQHRDLLYGNWRLVYSSGFNSGSLGGRRPGPPAALLPAILGQVYQRIDPNMATLDNVVELLLSYGPLDLGLLGAGGEALGRALGALGRELEAGSGPGPGGVGLPEPLRAMLAAAVTAATGAGVGDAGVKKEREEEGGDLGAWESPAARLTLRHDFEIIAPSTVRIVYEETYAELVGSPLFESLPRLTAPSLPPPLRPPKFLRSASFDVTYLDGSTRITRGDRGELRVYWCDDEWGQGEVGSQAAVKLDYED